MKALALKELREVVGIAAVALAGYLALVVSCAPVGDRFHNRLSRRRFSPLFLPGQGRIPASQLPAELILIRIDLNSSRINVWRASSRGYLRRTASDRLDGDLPRIRPFACVIAEFRGRAW